MSRAKQKGRGGGAIEKRTERNAKTSISDGGKLPPYIASQDSKNS